MKNIDKQKLVEAIKLAESQTSAEIRIHLENYCNSDPVKQAEYIFLQLGLEKTKYCNGVLIYIARKDRKVAIIGDSGLNEKIPADFWNEAYELMKTHFIEKQYTEGLLAAVKLTGEKLAQYFPPDADDINELQNDVSINENTRGQL